MIPTLLGITLIVMMFIEITPGDPARLMLGEQATDASVAELRSTLGLNDPLPVRYVRYIGNVLKGDLGTSYFTKRPVLSEDLAAFPVYSDACQREYGSFGFNWDSVGDLRGDAPIHVEGTNAAIGASLFCVSMPGFWFALLLIQWLVCQAQALAAVRCGELARLDITCGDARSGACGNDCAADAIKYAGSHPAGLHNGRRAPKGCRK